MPLRRFGRPGLLGTIGRTAVIAGTATMTSRVIQRHSEQRAAEQQAYAEKQSAPPGSGAPAPAQRDLVSRLSELAELRSSGALTDAEFQRAKAQLLG